MIPFPLCAALPGRPGAVRGGLLAVLTMVLMSCAATGPAQQVTDPYAPVPVPETDAGPVPADGKIRLIIRADDIGMCHGTNQALRRLLDARIVTSYSVMVTTPWLDEAVEILAGHPGVSVGVHTAVNSEWKEYRWGPVSPPDKVPSLVDEWGKFFPSRRLMMLNEPRVEEVAAEVRAQVDLAERKGLDLCYMDHHMSGAVNTLEMQVEFEKIAREKGLGISRHFGERDGRGVYADPPEEKLAAAIRGIEGLTTPGLYLLVVHPGTDGPEMSAMTDLNPGAPTAMSRHRQAETDVFCSPELRAAIERRGIELVGYREIIKQVGLTGMKRPFNADPYDKVLEAARK